MLGSDRRGHRQGAALFLFHGWTLSLEEVEAPVRAMWPEPLPCSPALAILLPSPRVPPSSVNVRGQLAALGGALAGLS